MRNLAKCSYEEFGQVSLWGIWPKWQCTSWSCCSSRPSQVSWLVPYSKRAGGRSSIKRLQWLNVPNIVIARLHQQFALKSICNTLTWKLFGSCGNRQCHQGSNEMAKACNMMSQDQISLHFIGDIDNALVLSKWPISNGLLMIELSSRPKTKQIVVAFPCRCNCRWATGWWSGLVTFDIWSIFDPRHGFCSSSR